MTRSAKQGTDLDLAFRLADLADAETLRRWSTYGAVAIDKSDGTPVTEADVAAEEAVLAAVRDARPDDGFLGEELGEWPGSNGRRWIVDGIDGTKFFATGSRKVVHLPLGRIIDMTLLSFESPLHDRCAPS